jgi:hypothetical protein
MSDADASAPPKPEAGGDANEHLNIKVTDGNNEVFFKIKRTTQLKKLMDAFCDRQGKATNSVRFLFDGTRVMGSDSPETVSCDPRSRFGGPVRHPPSPVQNGSASSALLPRTDSSDFTSSKFCERSCD